MNCKDCLHWKPVKLTEYDLAGQGRQYGLCSLITQAYSFEDVGDRTAMFTVSPSYDTLQQTNLDGHGDFITRSDFGCNAFSPPLAPTERDYKG